LIKYKDYTKARPLPKKDKITTEGHNTNTKAPKKKKKKKNSAMAVVTKLAIMLQSTF